MIPTIKDQHYVDLSNQQNRDFEAGAGIITFLPLAGGISLLFNAGSWEQITIVAAPLAIGVGLITRACLTHKKLKSIDLE